MSVEEQWLHVERYTGFPLRGVYLLAALWLWREATTGTFRVAAYPGWWAYLALTLLFTTLSFLLRRGRAILPLLMAAQLADLLFLTYTLVQAPLVAGPIVWLDALWLGKQALLAASLPTWYVIGFLAGPGYVLGLRLGSAHWDFLADPVFLQMEALLLVAILAGWGLAQYVHTLQRALAQERHDLAQKTDVLQRTATDLGARVLELRALQEIAHHLSTSLHLEEILGVVTRRARELFGVSRAAIALIDEERQTWQLARVGAGSASESSIPHLPEVIRRLAQGDMIRLPGVDDPDASLLSRSLGADWQAGELVIIPLIARGRLMAALLLGRSAHAQPFDERQEQLAESFAFLAATAIENARLYENVLEQRQELEAILQGIGDAVIVTDDRLRVLLANPVAVRTLHWSKAPVGMPLTDVVQNKDLVALVERVGKGEETPQVQDITFTFVGEKPRTYQAVTSAIRSHGHVSRGAVTVLRDVTAQKELERMKSNFISVVSHELKTPLHSIKGFVEIIRMGKAGPITDLQADFLTTVKEQTQVLQRMIDDLLVFSRLEAGQLRLNVEAISLAAIAAGVAQKLSPLAVEKHLQLRMLLPDDFPDIEGDYMRMEQVLTNLVENAIKFTPEKGQVVIAGEDRGERVRVWIQDTGIGIPESEQERIFDRFYQVDTSERRAYRGAGLGLTICKYIVERHHGHIWVESTPGHGSTFYIELPKHLPAVDEPFDFYSQGKMR